MKTVRIMLWLPLVAFLIVLALVAAGLIKPHSTTIDSRMVGKALPAFTLPSVRAGEPALASIGFADGQPRLLNIFASWCIPCAAEAPQLMALKQAGVRIEGVAVRDLPADTQGFLRQYGDPYDRIGHDDSSMMMVAMGSSGVPETFVIDGRGRILAQHIGEIRPEEVPAMIEAVRSGR